MAKFLIKTGAGAQIPLAQPGTDPVAKIGAMLACRLGHDDCVCQA
jgi:hypothetical protein